MSYLCDRIYSIFSGAEKFCFAHGLGQLKCNVKIEVRALSFIRLVVLLFYVHGKHLRSCQDGQLT